MAERNRASEIEAIRSRGYRSHIGTISEIKRLLDQWREQDSSLRHYPEFAITKTVTILEVSLKGWIKTLIDHGSPYADRADDLLKLFPIKLDLPTMRAVVSKNFTIGELIAHSVSANNVGDFTKSIDCLLNDKHFQEIENIYDRFSHEILGEPAIPIVHDTNEAKRILAYLFEIRHVIVHEMPVKLPFKTDEVENILKVAYEYGQATDELIAQKTIGKYPLTQRDMNFTAFDNLEKSTQQMNTVLSEKFGEDPDFAEAQMVWLQFADLQARFESQYGKPGSGTIAPTIYASTKRDLVEDRKNYILNMRGLSQ